MNKHATLSVKEAAELLGVGLGSTYRAVKRGALPALRVGRKPRFRVPRQAIEAVLADPARWAGVSPGGRRSPRRKVAA